MKKLILTLLITFLYGFGFSQEKQKVVGPDVIQFKTENQLLLNELGLDSNETDELCGSLLRFQKINSQVSNPAKFNETKKTIARLKTLLKGKLNA